jgi:phosphoribosylformylglycinamidine cyclo-ligase
LTAFRNDFVICQRKDVVVDSIDYKTSGVDVEAGQRFVQRIRRHTQSTMRPEVLSNIGSFAALCTMPTKYQEPVMVSGTDGVGTKLKLATALDKHDTIGIDCVAMCVNDVLCQGAEPLFFLDYLATGKLSIEQLEQVVAGLAEGCRQSGCALVGGETAEMPGFYQAGEYDIAGFCVGIVERSKIIKGQRIVEGDALLGLASSGIHSNGFSLVRKVIEVSGLAWDHTPEGWEESLGEAFLTPTRIYAKAVLEALERFDLRGLAHITGGGLVENVPRMFAAERMLTAQIQRGSWKVPEVFPWLTQMGNLSQETLDNTFNRGLGMVLALPEDQLEEAQAYFKAQGIEAWRIGQVISGKELVFV